MIMDNPSSSNKAKRPTPEDLAGIPVLIGDEDDNAILPAGMGSPTASSSRKNNGPTADQLAGIPLLLEGEEEIGVRPPKKKQ
jgi:hypothetical protein